MKTSTSSVRLSVDIRDYFKKKGINLRDILEDKYYEMKQNELPELLNEKAELEKRVLQIEDIVTHLEQENNKKVQKDINKIKSRVLSAFDPDYYIGKMIDGHKITKEQLDIWKEEGKP